MFINKTGIGINLYTLLFYFLCNKSPTVWTATQQSVLDCIVLICTAIVAPNVFGCEYRGGRLVLLIYDAHMCIAKYISFTKGYSTDLYFLKVIIVSLYVVYSVCDKRINGATLCVAAF